MSGRRSYSGRRAWRDRARLGHAFAWVVLTLRVLTAIAAIQLSGIPHFVSDSLAEAVTGHALGEEHERENDPDHDCPAGCPTCDHVHMSAASLPAAVLPPLVWSPLADAEVAVVCAPESVPPRSAPLTLYRPPKTCA